MMMSPIKPQMKTFTPDYSPVIKMMEMQTKLVIETSQAMMDLAMLPWKGLPVPKVPMPGMTLMRAGFGSICNPGGATKVEPVETPEPVAATEKAVEVVETVAETQAEVVEETVEVVADTVTETKETVAEATAEVAEDTAETVAEVAPAFLKAAEGVADDLTQISGVGPKLAETLNAMGIYHLKQIAEWTEANVAWVDANVTGVRGRASKNDWVAQAADLLK